jgi:hypothetical protein
MLKLHSARTVSLTLECGVAAVVATLAKKKEEKRDSRVSKEAAMSLVAHPAAGR